MNKTPIQIFVTGTDTGAGKTHFSSLLLRHWRESGFDSVLGLKPLVSGGEEDLDLLWEAQGKGAPKEALRYRSFALPAAPSMAAHAQGQEIQPAALVEWCQSALIKSKRALVEGAGGWMVPINGTWCIADFAVALDLPVVLVVPNRLGALNHCILTAEDITRRGLRLAGIVLTRLDSSVSSALAEGNLRILTQEFYLPVLGELPFGCDRLPLEIASALEKSLQPK